MFDGRLMRHSDGTVTLAGIDMGGRGKILAENDETIVIKWPKSTHWSSVLSPREYVSSFISVYSRVEKKAGHRSEKIERLKGLIEWDVTRKRKEE